MGEVKIVAQPYPKPGTTARARRWRSRTALTMAVGLAMTAVTLASFSHQPASAAVSCSSGKTLNIVAHEDDDLLFLSPDLLHDVQSGRCVRTIFVTAGDAGADQTYWLSREDGEKAAYRQMIGGTGTWNLSDAGISGHPIPVFTDSRNSKVSLAFMRLPDGVDGDGTGTYGNESLQNLWEGELAAIHAVNGTSGYTRAQLISTLTGLMSSFKPDQIRVQDYLGQFGGEDHSDHYATARFANEAHLSYSTTHAFSGYYGYRTKSYLANVSGTDLTAKQNAFYAYNVYDAGDCPSTPQCVGTLYERWLPRQYKIGTSNNLARSATATASSEDLTEGQGAAKAIDGRLSGYPEKSSMEWATIGGREGSWLKLTWATPQTINKIVLYDRPNDDDQILGGSLQFSNGSSIGFDALDNAGISKIITFSSMTVTSVQVNISSVSSSTYNTGLQEIEAYAGAGP
jgi:LmbE family N-acetylglucosaminyl deacetylase